MIGTCLIQVIRSFSGRVLCLESDSGGFTVLIFLRANFSYLASLAVPF